MPVSLLIAQGRLWDPITFILIEVFVVEGSE